MNILATFKSFLPDTAGGIPTVIYNYASGLAPEFRTRILTCGLPGGLPGDVALNGISVRRVKTYAYLASNPVSPGYFRSLAAEARHAELVALHAPFPSADIALAAGAIGQAPFVVHWHSDLVSYPLADRLLAPLFRRTLDRAEAIVVSDERLIHPRSPIYAARAKCRIAPFGVDADEWAALDDDELDRIRAFRERSRPLVVACGRLVPYKGFDVLIDAARGLEADVVIIGTGPSRQTLAARIADRGVQDQVRLVGAVSDSELKCWLHAADVFALPSRTAAETFGLVQIEAMACARPVVNTALPTSVPLVARHGREGLTVRPNDAASLHQALKTLIGDPGYARELGARGLARVRQDYRLSQSVEAVRSIYREAVA